MTETADLFFDTRERHAQLFSSGWRDGSDMLAVVEPATGDHLATVGAATAEDVAVSAANAVRSQAAWGAMDPRERAALLAAAADILQRNGAAYADWITRESGSIRSKSGFEVAMGVAELREASTLCSRPTGELLSSGDTDRLSFAERIPIGVVGVITPWNVPLILALRSVAPALALGNAVVLKPDPHTPVCGGLLLAEVFERAGIPEGVFSVLPGDVEPSEALVLSDNVDMISFTGSTTVGRRVGELAGRSLKRVALELGGNNPVLVLEDADVDRAAAAAAWGSFFHQGQVCMASGRHLVHRSIVGSYTTRLAEIARNLTVGDPFKHDVALGPLIDEGQLERVERIVSGSRATGSRVLAGGEHRGLFYKATVLGDVAPDSPAFVDEIFGPIAPIVVFDDEEEAIELANQTDYGLTAAVHSRDIPRALAISRQLRTGIVHVNDQTINDEPQAPFGGRGSSGNGARYGTVSNVEEFTQWRWTTVRSRCPDYELARPPERH